jgi:uncharacterized protein YndB with AHSA1/START domain
MSEPGVHADEARVMVQLAASPSRAFEVFTTETDLWWGRGPAYRIGGRHPGTLRFEPGVGGRLIEVFEAPSGERAYVAGEIVAWEPGERLVFSWRGVNFKAHERTEVEVRFEAVGAGTRVTVIHRGFAALPKDHPVRHGQPEAAFIAGMGRWWGALLSSLRRRCVAPTGP